MDYNLKERFEEWWLYNNHIEQGKFWSDIIWYASVMGFGFFTLGLKIVASTGSIPELMNLLTFMNSGMVALLSIFCLFILYKPSSGIWYAGFIAFFGLTSQNQAALGLSEIWFLYLYSDYIWSICRNKLFGKN